MKAERLLEAVQESLTREWGKKALADIERLDELIKLRVELRSEISNTKQTKTQQAIHQAEQLIKLLKS